MLGSRLFKLGRRRNPLHYRRDREDVGPIAPRQFAPADWDTTQGPLPGQIIIDILALPNNGGSPITALQYNLGAGWIALAGTGTGPRTVTAPDAGTEYAPVVRAVNAVGSGNPSTPKPVTSAPPAATAPMAFAAEQWDVATGPDAAQITIAILELPADGGSPITALQYSNGGAWTNLPGLTVGDYVLDMPAAATEYPIQLRSQNAVDFSDPSDTKTVTSEVAPIDSVVVIGASLMFAMFGQNLSTPNSTATTQLAAEGHSLPVYGWATNGATLADADAHYSAARAAHPNALILMHFGGNDVSNDRLYPGGTANFNTRLAELLAVADGDERFYPASITFRDYNDNTFITPANGSKPYNENLLLPWIAANFPHAMASYGRPMLDFYRRVLQDFETWLHPDNVHLNSTGYAAFRPWIMARVADLLEGVVPAEITERVYAPPVEPAMAIVNFMSPASPAFVIPYNNVNVGGATLGIADVLDVNGDPTGVSMGVAFTGSPAIGSTTPPGRGRNSDGQTGSLSPYAGQLLSVETVGTSLFITTGVTAVLTFDGLEPGQNYEWGMVANRVAGTTRNTVLTIGGIATTWNTSENPPQERNVVVPADDAGIIQAVLSVGPSTTYAYLGALSFEPTDLPATDPGGDPDPVYEWTPIVPVDGGPQGASSAFFRGVVTPDGPNYRVTTAASSTNGRAAYPLPAVGTQMVLEASIAFGAATRLICRQVVNNDSTTGTTVFDVNRPSEGAVLDLTGVNAVGFTVGFGNTLLHFIGVTATGQFFTINAATRIRTV